MLAFKVMNDPFVGSLTFCRIYSGKVGTGAALVNTVKDKRERVGRMLQMHSNHREDIKEAFAGDIVALAGLKEVTTGDTLCDPQKPVVLERMEFPEPVIEIAIEPKTKGDQEKMGIALNRLAQEDPSFRVKTDQESRARRSSPAWASCISTSSSIACAASSRSRPISARRRSPIARRSPGRPRSTTPTRSRPAVRASSPASSFTWSRPRRAGVSCSIRRSSAATCRRNTFRASKRGSKA